MSLMIIGNLYVRVIRYGPISFCMNKGIRLLHNKRKEILKVVEGCCVIK